jgi:sucrose phosphorylase
VEIAGDELYAHLSFLYSSQQAGPLVKRLRQRIAQTKASRPIHKRELTERDAILIVYPDQLQQPESPHLRTLRIFCEKYLQGLVSAIHLLPFFPYSSDDGFSVIDYRKVNPEVGTWEEVRALGKNFRLMFDAVINHVSAQSTWFQSFLQDKPPQNTYFITTEGEPDLSAVIRPRSTPLQTAFQTASGPKLVWTTFSRDQVDLNFHNPEVLLEIIDVLLFYVEQGAQFVRLDAIGYLWKEIGTTCIHLPQTHRIVQLLRAVLDKVAPDVLLITETNVPHRQNLTYFGDGTNETQLVYNFALPPLVLHAILKEDATHLANWLANLELPSEEVWFLNYLASHDGIGLPAARGILPEYEIDWLIDRVVERGGLISYKEDGEGRNAYELNINFFDALGILQRSDQAESVQLDRFLVAHAIMLSMRGVPAIYFHSLFGSRGWIEGVQQTGQNRALNRQKLTLHQLDLELADRSSLRHQAYSRLSGLLQTRSMNAAFHPNASQRIVKGNESVLAILRRQPSGDGPVLCLHNLSARSTAFELAPKDIFGNPMNSDFLSDILSGKQVTINSSSRVALGPYETFWLSPGE